MVQALSFMINGDRPAQCQHRLVHISLSLRSQYQRDCGKIIAEFVDPIISFFSLRNAAQTHIGEFVFHADSMH